MHSGGGPAAPPMSALGFTSAGVPPISFAPAAESQTKPRVPRAIQNEEGFSDVGMHPVLSPNAAREEAFNKSCWLRMIS